MGLAIAMTAIIIGLVACFLVQCLAIWFNQKTVDRLVLATFVVVPFAVAPFIQSILV
jgi:hypothetical protein